MPLALMGTMIAGIYKRQNPKYKRQNPKYKREREPEIVNTGNVQLGSTHVNIDGCPSVKKIAYQKITCSVQQRVNMFPIFSLLCVKTFP
jgi:hypothetical protein